jgi:hypothetical protein
LLAPYRIVPLWPDIHAGIFNGGGEATEAVIVERLFKYIGTFGAELAAELGTNAFKAVGQQLEQCSGTLKSLGNEEDARCKLDVKFKFGSTISLHSMSTSATQQNTQISLKIGIVVSRSEPREG